MAHDCAKMAHIAVPECQIISFYYLLVSQDLVQFLHTFLLHIPHSISQPKKLSLPRLYRLLSMVDNYFYYQEKMVCFLSMTARQLASFLKIATLFQKSLALRVRNWSDARLRRLNFDRWGRSTKVFRPWMTEPLHPAYFIYCFFKPFR